MQRTYIKLSDLALYKLLDRNVAGNASYHSVQNRLSSILLFKTQILKYAEL